MSAESHLLTTSRQAHRWVRVVALRAPLRLGAFATLALLTTWRWLSTAGSVNAFRDAHVLGHYESVAAQSLLRFHQLPLWDPYYCGGMYLLGTPQARFVSPTFVLSLLFGEPRGEALTTFVMVVVGLEGTFRYARAQGARSAGALLAAPLFALSGVFAIAPRLGWINFFSFELLPWIALGTQDGRGRRRCGARLVRRLRWNLRGADGRSLVRARAARRDDEAAGPGAAGDGPRSRGAHRGAGALAVGRAALAHRRDAARGASR